MAMGAYFLELMEENLSMLSLFSKSATEERKHYPISAFTFEGQIYEGLHESNEYFVRQIPQTFEITDTKPAINS